MDDEKKTEDLLEEEIRATIKTLSNIQQSTDEYTEVVNNLETLYQLKIDDMKTRLEYDVKLTGQEDDRLDKERQAEERRIDRYLRLALGVAEIGLPLLFYGCWMKRGFRFEETGTFTSATFKGLINRFRPTK